MTIIGNDFTLIISNEIVGLIMFIIIITSLIFGIAYLARSIDNKD